MFLPTAILLICVTCTHQLSVLATNCQNGFEDVGNGLCYLTYPFLANAVEAEVKCAESDAHSVVPANAFVNSVIVNEAQMFGIEMWLGIQCTTNKSDDCILMNGDKLLPSAYHNFLSGHPNPSIGHCVFLDPNSGKWYSDVCSANRGYGCLKNTTDTSVTCGSAYTLFEGNCYRLISHRDDIEPEAQCNLDCGHMTSIVSAEENEFVKNMAQSKPNGLFYLLIGLNQEYTTDYKWNDGNVLGVGNYSNFGYVKPDIGLCMSMYLQDGFLKAGQWISSSCASKYPSVCKRSLVKPCSPKPKPLDTVPPLCPSLTYISRNRTIYSPGYKENTLPPRFTCGYAIQGPSNHIVQFALKDHTNYLTFALYERTTDIIPFLNSSLYPDAWYGSQGPTMKIEAQAPNTYQKFEASVNYIDVRPSGCNQGELSTPGTISTINYPEYYPSLYKCSYLMKAPVGNRVCLTFTSKIDLYYTDGIFFYDGRDASAALLTVITSTDDTTTVNSTSNYLYAEFQSTTNYNNGKGFQANFISV